jgi:hypothetical protein
VAEAIFGLVGVIVGAVVTGGVEFVAERRREAALLRKAARLVEAELDEAATIFEGALEDGKLWSGSNRPEVPSWREYAPCLRRGSTQMTGVWWRRLLQSPGWPHAASLTNRSRRSA